MISGQDPLASSNPQSWPTPVPRRLQSASPQASIRSGERVISSVLLNNREKTTGHSSWPCKAQRLPDSTDQNPRQCVLFLSITSFSHSLLPEDLGGVLGNTVPGNTAKAAQVSSLRILGAQVPICTPALISETTPSRLLSTSQVEGPR